MALKDILIHMDSSQACAARLDLAVALAAKNGAHLTGLYVIPHRHYTPQQRGVEQMGTEVEALFLARTAKTRISAEWRCIDWGVTGVGMSELINMHAYNRDLVIIGQSDDSFRDEDIPRDLPERVVIGSGRPVLVVPYAGSFATMGQRILIAWQSGRESVRALNDALPLLQDAHQVRIIAVDSAVVSPETATTDLTEISAHLSRHGIQAKTEKLIASNIPTGDVLLNSSWEEGCDLIVMGACTYTTGGAPALGPVARHVLSHMPTPVLMSH